VACAACGGGDAATAPGASGPAPATSATAPKATGSDPAGPASASTGTAARGWRFTDVTRGSGITLENVSGDPVAKMAIPENIGQGAAALDYDGDGRLDLFIANGDVYPGTKPRATPRPALYRNAGGLRFEDVTEAAGLLFPGWMHGARAIDFDADGHPDLYVTLDGAPNRFFRNKGDGTFEDASATWGGADPGPSTAAAFFDADGDGDLDLYVGNYVVYDPEHPPNGGQPCEWKGLKVSCGPKGTTPGPDTFYENRDGRLVPATEAFGFAAPASYTLGAITCDADGDGDLDLYVANDSEANRLFLNEGGGHFREAGMELGVDLNEDGVAQAGMGVDCADVDNDGRFDLFVTNFSHDANAFYHNVLTPSGRTMFTDETYVMDLGRASYAFLSWGTRVLDLDFDGWQDIVVVSGHVYPQVDTAPVGSTYRQRNQVFENLGPTDGRLRFRELEPAADDAFAKVEVSRGLVAADLDNDGDPDFLVVEMDAPPTLIRNDVEKHGAWIGLALRGEGKNVDAIGARVEVEDALGIVRWRLRTSGESYLSSSDPRLVIGLGPANDPVRAVRVRWPSGRTQEHTGLATGRYWLIEAGASEARPLELP
jgi:enediyne biosynthesis protein E4